jgi:hypothetical protein
MASNTTIAAQEETARMNIHELVQRLNSHLGATVVAALAGVRDSKLPYRWAKAGGTTPNAGAIDRLQFAHRIWVELSDAESDHVARNWFVGSNPLLGEIPPYMALREGRTKETLEAAQGFINGSWVA